MYYENPFLYFDQLRRYAISGWFEAGPFRPNGGLFFARGDSSSQIRKLARRVLHDFVRRQGEVFHDPEVGWRAIGQGVVPVMAMEEVRDKYPDVAFMIQHVTDDQDMLRDCLESAARAKRTEDLAYRGLRVRIAEGRSNNTDMNRIQSEPHALPTIFDLQSVSPEFWPDFSQTAGKTLGCYSSTSSGSVGSFVELSTGTKQGERILVAPEWLLRGPQGSCDEHSLRPAAVVHCVGKKPACLYPKAWRTP